MSSCFQALTSFKATGVLFSTAATFTLYLACLPLTASAQEVGREVTSSGAPQLTIYNQQFAVVREPLTLPLAKGTTRLTYTGATAHVEPDSVILRNPADPTDKRSLRILEQNYEADPISADLLLQRFEGKTIEFALPSPDGGERRVTGKIIRAPYVLHAQALNRYNSQYAGGQYGFASGGGNQPIIEIDGKLRFGLPGTPLFPALGSDVNLRPTLSWSLQSDAAQTITAELAYISGGMSWEAAYSLVVPEVSNKAEFAGLVTMDNQSGKSFENARIQLMAGDITKIQQERSNYGSFAGRRAMADSAYPGGPQVTERSFDEYHLYTLALPSTLKDRETKQVEFVRAAGIDTVSTFVYDGASINYSQYNGWSDESIRQQREYGTQSNPKVWIMREFKNTKANGLGIALPEGKVRFYRRESSSGALQFVGENRISHTPQGESVRVYTGSAFDIVGERKQTNYVYDSTKRTVDETFEITLRNRKTTPATVTVVEHLYRSSTWRITERSQTFVKKDSRTMEFTLPLAPNQEKSITYTVHYTW